MLPAETRARQSLRAVDSRLVSACTRRPAHGYRALSAFKTGNESRRSPHSLHALGHDSGRGDHDRSSCLDPAPEIKIAANFPRWPSVDPFALTLMRIGMRGWPWP
ncbi:MAG: hypothetical protein NVSMB1_05760 [Polyangiales bacterium]